MKKINISSNMFSPPYGDGTEFIPERIIAKRFSPPYGDGTNFV